MLNLPGQFIIFDTEWTTWEGAQERKWSGPNEYREIVEIGAVKVNGETLAEAGELVLMVKPKINPKLSDFFIKLTGITQAKVDREGIRFEGAMRRFADWSGGLPLYSFGGDEPVIEENCRLFNIPFPFEWSRFYDVRAVFQKHGIPAENYLSSTIIEAFGKKNPRRSHEALNDARDILSGLRELRARVG